MVRKGSFGASLESKGNRLSPHIATIAGVSLDKFLSGEWPLFLIRGAEHSGLCYDVFRIMKTQGLAYF